MVPSSNMVWVGDPPMEERFAVTASPVLVGLPPAVTRTLATTALSPQLLALVSDQEPTPEGLVGSGLVNQLIR